MKKVYACPSCIKGMVRDDSDELICHECGSVLVLVPNVDAFYWGRYEEEDKIHYLNSCIEVPQEAYDRIGLEKEKEIARQKELERIRQEEKEKKLAIENQKILEEKEERHKISELHAERAEKESEILAMNAEYEYAIEVVYDKRDGGADINALNAVLTKRAVKGWRLKNVLTNELGVNKSSLGYGGFSVGTNSTMDQVVLIFERKVRDAKK